jgi:alpha-glucosidase
MTIFLVLLLFCMMPSIIHAAEVASPDGCNVVSVEQVNDEFYYNLSRKGQQLLTHSRLGLEMDNHNWERALARKYPQYDCWMNGFTVDSVTYSQHRGNIHNFYGEQADVPDDYNVMILHLAKHDGSDYRLDIQVRAFNEGVAFRYFLPEHPQAVFHKVVADLTEYSFPAGTKVWAAEWAQAPYELKDVNDITSPIERTVTVVLPDGQCCALADADVDDWCLQKNVASVKKANTLTTWMYSPVDVVTYYATPWKVIITGDSYGQLLEHRYLIDNLNLPCEIADAAEWVKPGTIMRCTTLTTEAAIRCIDFCSSHHIDYMLFDWKWYEPCASHDGDATEVISAIDMPRVVQYGKEHGVGIWLYVNQHALQKQMRELFPLLHEWGVVGVKSGFVEYASHRWATWLHDLVRYAAENRLMVNIHDEFRPAGFSRTYPNLLNQEGIRGNEEWPDTDHNTILPFTRMINGAADYTICYYDKRLKNTHGHQLAASLVYYAPLLTVFWYDTPDRYHGEPEIEWFEQLPTVWDETRVIDGAPGEGIVIMRRKGSDYYLAVMGNNQSSIKQVSLDFLPSGRSYHATIYEDDPHVPTTTHIRIRNQKVNNKKFLRFSLQPRGGAVVRFSLL